MKEVCPTIQFEVSPFDTDHGWQLTANISLSNVSNGWPVLNSRINQLPIVPNTKRLNNVERNLTIMSSRLC